jgi:mannosyltransferase OCH1-like enzyme
MSSQRIPKIIHYCWFGGNPLPEDAVACIESWKKFCPDYEIIEWNETNYDIKKNSYMNQAYQHRKWGFVPDYARLDIIYTHGGVYLDTDVELIKPLDDLLELEAFAGVESNSEYVALGLGFGARPHDELIKALRDYYDELSFVKENGELNITPAPIVNHAVLLENGYSFSKKVNQCKTLTIFPSEYFCPKDCITNKIKTTPNTYSIHHYDSSWISDEKRYAKNFRERHPHIPRFIAPHISCFVAAWKFRGFIAAIKEIGVYFKERKKQKKLEKEAKNK